MNAQSARELYQNLDLLRGAGPMQIDKELAGWLKNGANPAERRELLLTWLETIGAGHARLSWHVSLPWMPEPLYWIQCAAPAYL
jgi:hypothetical protein